MEGLAQCSHSNAVIKTRASIAADGFTYEHEFIANWLLTNKTSPKTGAVLDHIRLFPNTKAQKLIDWAAHRERIGLAAETWPPLVHAPSLNVGKLELFTTAPAAAVSAPAPPHSILVAPGAMTTSPPAFLPVDAAVAKSATTTSATKQAPPSLAPRLAPVCKDTGLSAGPPPKAASTGLVSRAVPHEDAQRPPARPPKPASIRSTPPQVSAGINTTVAALLESCNDFESRPAECEEACKQLMSLALTQEGQLCILESGGVDALLVVPRFHQAHTSAGEALAILATNCESIFQMDIVVKGGVEKLLQVGTPGNAIVVAALVFLSGNAKLYHLFSDKSEMMVKYITALPPACLVDVQNARAVCNALTSLTTNCTPDTVVPSAVTFVLTALQKFPDDAAVAKHAGQTLCNFMNGNGREIATRTIAASSQGVSILCAALAKHKSAPICCVLVTLDAVDAAVGAKLVTLGGLEALVGGLSGATEPIFARCVCVALSTLIEAGEHIEKLAIERGAWPALLVCAKFHAANAALHETITQTLGDLAMPFVTQRSVAANMVDATIHALLASARGHVENAKIVSQVCKVLSRLMSSSPEFKAAVVGNSDCVDGFLLVLHKHGANERVCLFATGLLSPIICDSHANRALFIERGGVAVFTALRRTHPGSDGICKFVDASLAAVQAPRIKN